MQEKYYILLDKLINILIKIFIIIIILFGLYIMIEEPFSESKNISLICTIMFLLFIIYISMIKVQQMRFSDKILNSDIFEFNIDNIDKLCTVINEKCCEKGYIYKHTLHTNLDELFTLYTTDNSEFPKEKIGVYQSKQYECEAQSDWDLSSGEHIIVPGQGRFHFEYRPFLNMICGKSGRDYDYPRDWVDVEATIIVIVDEWNGMLNKVLNHGWHLPFVLFCVIVKSEPNKLFIAKDNRKKKRNDYFIKRDELFDILGVENRNPIGEMKYTDCKEYFEIISSKEFRKVIEERNKQGRYYL